MLLDQSEGDMHMTMNNDYDEVMARLSGVKPVNQRDPYVGHGQHSLIVHSIDQYNDQKWGTSYRVMFFFEASTHQTVGSLGVRTYNINKPSEFPTQATDADQLADFICTLQGIKLGEHHASSKALLVSKQRGGDLESQRARGCRINATGQPPRPGMTRAGRPKAYTAITWQTVPNDQTSIMANRTMLDQKFPLGAQSAPAPQQQQYTPPGSDRPQYVQQPAPQYVQQPAPQLQQGYQQPGPHAPQPQFAPNVVQPYMPPQQMQPQGYTQPVYGQAHVQPVQGAPTGGFLAMLPPKQEHSW